jgi:hypothetical protein
MDRALALINGQQSNINDYFNTADTSFETQYGQLYGQAMTDAINAMAGSGIFDSPVSENALNRTRTALANTYATGKSQLAGQKMAALGGIEQQKVNYYQNLANLQYQDQTNKQQEKMQTIGAIGAIGAALI